MYDIHKRAIDMYRTSVELSSEIRHNNEIEKLTAFWASIGSDRQTYLSFRGSARQGLRYTHTGDATTTKKGTFVGVVPGPPGKGAWASCKGPPPASFKKRALLQAKKKTLNALAAKPLSPPNRMGKPLQKRINGSLKFEPPAARARRHKSDTFHRHHDW